ncbi:site-specific integrase [Synechococcus sp. LTW-R]|uniref:site-specific integrase n=1 Tax=Synechococcus sp. LTW-R TaxID=2751170 RepID=UPI0016284E06|nr:site-specific integrase [Synechococcus sp. LTW-R]QNG29937.1 site-specific integrase [Synechococcus sp. LTW-R]
MARDKREETPADSKAFRAVFANFSQNPVRFRPSGPFCEKPRMGSAEAESRPFMSESDFEAAFRRAIKRTCGAGWYVRESSGRIRLDVRGEKGLTLDLKWNQEGADRALPRIQEIFKRFAAGAASLAEAANLTNTASSEQDIDLQELVETWRRTKPNTSDATFDKDHRPSINNALRLLASKNPPPDGERLCEAALAQWSGTSQALKRQQRSLRYFLEWAVKRGALKPRYLPGTPLTIKAPDKKTGYPLSDAQILRLLDSIQTEVTGNSGHSLRDVEAAKRWKFAIQLAAVYGLRPEDLNWLTVKQGPEGPELWSMYRKSKGGIHGKRTKERRLAPLFVRDLDGTPLDWNLLGRFQLGEKLPSLGPTGLGKPMTDKKGEPVESVAADRLKTYLSRRPVWKQLVAEGALLGETCTAYSFRHRFVKESYAAGFDRIQISEMCGHTVDVHDRNYARFQPSGTAKAYAKANEGAVMAV